MSVLLYRGVNCKMYERDSGGLIPKEFKPFLKSSLFGRAEFGNSHWGNCSQNAVFEHQQGCPTSGISTTPIFDRAVFYATHSGKYSKGMVYVIDQNICRANGIKMFNVNGVIHLPSVPEDEEIILVSDDFEILTNEIIIDIIKC